MPRRDFVTAVAAAALMPACRRKGPAADLLLYNGLIHLAGPGFETAEAVAIGGGRIVAAGSSDALRSYSGAGTEVVDLKGASVIPGINDSHLHAMMWSLGSPPFTLAVGYPTVKSIADIVEAVRVAASERPAGSWIVGWGWDQPYFAEGRAPTRADLDAVSPDHPVILTEFSGHAVWVNSKALELAGVTRTTEAPQGGIIVRDTRGEPTGVLFESAGGLVRRLLPPVSDADRARALEQVMARVAAAGITSFTEPGLDRTGLDAYAALYRSGKGTARLTALRAGGRSVDAVRDALQDMPALDGIDARFMRLAGIKLFADGIPTNNKTAWLHDPYVGGGDGELVVRGRNDDERIAELHAMIRAVHDAGWQIGTHATGDRAIDTVVGGYLAAQEMAPRPDPRHYLIHADLTMPGTLDRMAAAGIGANFNAAIKHLIADGQVASIGAERAGYEWPYRRALDAGVKVASSSDAPVTDANWGKGLAMCVGRKGNQSGTVFGPDQRITLDEALASYTATGAWQDRSEDWKGRLVPGYAADLCVLDRRLPDVDTDDLPAVGVVLTVVDGRVVYRKG